MYFLPQFRDQGKASLPIRHDLVSLLRPDSGSWSPRDKKSSLFDAQNAGNSVLELPDFLPSKRGLTAPC